MLAALLLFLYNQQEDQYAGQEAESLLGEVQAAIGTQILPSVPANAAEAESVPGETGETQAAEIDPTMTVVQINGYDYVGYLEIPDIYKQLPVMAEWDYVRLKVAPCRQFGSTKTDDLVIAAHNFNTHFGRLRELKAGAAVTFTDMDGVVSGYKVEKIETIAPTDVELVVNSGYDLVLYTCTPGGQTRVCVFCNRTGDGDSQK